MNQKLKEFLDAKKAEETRLYEQEKCNTLMDLGLYEKVYSQESTYSEAFPYSEWADDGSVKYYNKLLIEITDEEYQELKKTLDAENNTSGGNPIAMVLKVIAWVTFVCGFIAGIALGTETKNVGYYYDDYKTVFSFAVAITYWGVSFVSGMMFLGFAEIIKLLNDIKKK